MTRNRKATPTVLFAGMLSMLGLLLSLAVPATAGTLTVQTGSKYAGSYGLQVTADGTPAFVQSSHPNGEKTYRVRFFVNLSRLNLASNSDFDLFAAYSGADPSPSAAPTGNAVLRAVVFEQGDGSKWLEVYTRTDSGEVQVSSSPELENGWRAIELQWSAATSSGASNGFVNLWVDGVAVPGLSNLDSDGQAINYARWGSVTGVSTSTAPPGAGVNSFKIDDFTSQRADYIGLVNVFSDIGGLDQSLRQYVHAVYHAGFTNGCATNPLQYCPNNLVTRAEMAKFLELGKNGEVYTPPVATTSSFADVPSNHWARDWIEQLYVDGFTNGCALNPRRFCPDSPVSRAEMAKFLLLARHGASYTPPSVVASSFADVLASHWAKDWIEQLYVEGLTSGCGTSPLRYCPDDLMTRWQMAKALSLTFELPVPNSP